jgi:hypothetical protein
MKKNSYSTITPAKLNDLKNNRMLFNAKRLHLNTMVEVVATPKRITKLNLTLKSPRKVKTCTNGNRHLYQASNLPSFMFDFLDEERPRIPRPPRDPINIFKQYPKKVKKFEYDVFSIRDKSSADATDTVLIDQTTTNKRRSSIDNSLYRPYVVEISPRSNVTLYSIDPISFSSEPVKSLYKKKRKLPTTSHIRNISVEKGRKETVIQRVVINTPAKSFAEKLQRIQDIAKEAEESFKFT